MTQIYSPKLEIQLVFSAIMVLKNYEERKPQSFHALIECSINNMEYIKRICDEELSDKLEAFGAVHIVGPKWCGKTTTAKQFAKSYIEMQDPAQTSGPFPSPWAPPSPLSAFP